MSKGKLTTVYKKDPEVICKTIDKEVVILPIGADIPVEDLGAFYILKSRSARLLWELIDGKRTVQELKNALLERFDVSAARAESDLRRFLKDLEAIKAIRIRD